MAFGSRDPTVFLFGGQGTQFFGMGSYHFENDAVFRASAVDLDSRFVAAGHPGVLEAVMTRRSGDTFGMTQVELSHPGIVMMQLALFDSVVAAGVVPDVLVGSSLGELVALCAAGVLDRDWLVQAVVAQVRALHRREPQGAMLAVLDNHALLDDAPDRWAPLELAGISASRHFVVAGPRDAVEARQRMLRQQGIGAELAPVPYPFHSSLIDVIRDDFAESVADLVVQPATAVVVSCVTGRPLDHVSAEHLWRIVREPFRWQDAAFHVETSSPSPPRYVDLSPSGSMSGYLRMDFGSRVDGRLVALTGPFVPESSVRSRLRDAGIHVGPEPGDQHMTSSTTAARPQDVARRAEAATPARAAFVFPGQGAQRLGMGADLFDHAPEIARRADEILGYSVRTLCTQDPDGRLNQTQFTQPALFVVGALHWHALLAAGTVHDEAVLAGHSLGEITALFAAGVLDFDSGLRLVAERGRLMSTVSGGAMAAVIGLSHDDVQSVLQSVGASTIDIANINSGDQIVISGPGDDIRACADAFSKAGARFVMLPVSGAFHSRYMRAVSAPFAEALDRTTFRPATRTVVANVTAQPYGTNDPAELLARQMVSPVRWFETVGWFMDRGITVTETGPGQILTNLTRAIGSQWTVTPSTWPVGTAATAPPVVGHDALPTGTVGGGRHLGSESFRRTHGLDYAYVCGGMYRGLASVDLVSDAAGAGLLAYFGSGGLPVREVGEAIDAIRGRLPAGRSFGVDIVHDALNSGAEESLVDLLIERDVHRVEASAFMRVTPAVVRYVLSGLAQGAGGTVERRHHVLAKVSRPEVAREFLAPADRQIVDRLLAQGLVTAEQAELARRVPVADDLCVEGDSGGHTDRRNPLVLLPALQRESTRSQREHGYPDRVRVGLAGGIGTPEAAAAALVMGADFVLTGSINLCTAESGMSEYVKELLETMDIQDTDYAPAGDMFELGAQVQVLRRGVFFPARARKLLELYRAHGSLAELSPRDRNLIEKSYFKKSIDEVWADTQRHFAESDPAQLERAATDERHRMALVFRWYFGHGQRAAMSGDPDLKLDFQVHCGPALGSLNSWLRDTTGEGWRDRHVGALGTRIMDEAASVLASASSSVAVGTGA